MNTTLRRVTLALTVVLGLYVGIWAQFFHTSFYNDFPGFGLHWIRLYGPENEHLISDTGSAYLAFTSLSVVGLIRRRADAGRLAGLVWTVFGVLHFAFHATHLMGDATDRTGNIVSLGISALLGAMLLVLPTRRSAAESETR